jgi:hypothetical protein
VDTIDGIVDSILVDTAEIGAAGAGLTAINLPNQTMDIVGNITGNLSGSVGSVTGAVGSVTGNVGGNVTGTIGGMTVAALKDFFDTDSGTTYASAVAGSVVAEIADNAGGASLTVQDIVDGVWDEDASLHVIAGSTGGYLVDAGSYDISALVWDEDATGHQTGGTFGQAIGDPAADTKTIYAAVVTDAAGTTVAADIIAIKADTAAILADTGTDGVIVASLAANSITATVIANAAIDAATFATGAIDAAAIAADAGTEIGTAVWATATRTLTALDEDSTTIDLDATIAAAVPSAATIADAVWDEDATGHQTGGTFGQAIGDPGADTNTIFKTVITDAAGTNIAADIIAIKAETASILTDTAEIGAAGAGLTVLATQASVNTIDDFLDTEVAAIKAKTDSLTFTQAGVVDANIQMVNDISVTGNGELGTEWGPV